VIVKKLNAKLPPLPKPDDPIAMQLAVAKSEQSSLVASFSADLDGELAVQQAALEKEHIHALVARDKAVAALAESEKHIEAVNKKRLAHWQFEKRLSRDAGRRPPLSPVRVRSGGSGQRRSYGPPVTAG